MKFGSDKFLWSVLKSLMATVLEGRKVLGQPVEACMIPRILSRATQTFHISSPYNHTAIVRGIPSTTLQGRQYPPFLVFQLMFDIGHSHSLIPLFLFHDPSECYNECKYVIGNERTSRTTVAALVVLLELVMILLRKVAVEKGQRLGTGVTGSGTLI